MIPITLSRLTYSETAVLPTSVASHIRVQLPTSRPEVALFRAVALGLLLSGS